MSSDLINAIVPKAHKDEHGNWTQEAKVALVQRMLIHGNTRRACHETGIPIGTVNIWKNSDWFGNLVDEIKLQNKLDLSNKISNVVDRALEILMDRLENGDFVLNNKTGEVIRRPAALRDVSKVVSDVLGKKLIMEKNIDSSVGKQETMQDTLKSLASEFAKFNKKINKQSAETIEFVEVIDDAVHDKRKEGLQEGSS